MAELLMSGAVKGLGKHLDRVFEMVPRSPRDLGSSLRSHLEIEQGGVPAHHPHLSPNNSTLVGFCTSYF